MGRLVVHHFHLRRWESKLSVGHCHRYVDEFTYRFNGGPDLGRHDRQATYLSGLDRWLIQLLPELLR